MLSYSRVVICEYRRERRSGRTAICALETTFELSTSRTRQLTGWLN